MYEHLCSYFILYIRSSIFDLNHKKKILHKELHKKRVETSSFQTKFNRNGGYKNILYCCKLLFHALDCYSKKLSVSTMTFQDIDYRSNNTH